MFRVDSDGNAEAESVSNLEMEYEEGKATLASTSEGRVSCLSFTTANQGNWRPDERRRWGEQDAENGLGGYDRDAERSAQELG